MVKNPIANAGDPRDICTIARSGRFPSWQPTPVTLLGKSCGQRGYSPESGQDLTHRYQAEGLGDGHEHREEAVKCST